MKKLNCWVTADGEVHLAKQQAIRHADARYGEALTRLAHTAVRIGKYVEMCDWIEKNLPRFLELEALRLDTLEEPEDDG